MASLCVKPLTDLCCLGIKSLYESYKALAYAFSIMNLFIQQICLEHYVTVKKLDARQGI